MSDTTKAKLPTPGENTRIGEDRSAQPAVVEPPPVRVVPGFEPSSASYLAFRHLIQHPALKHLIQHWWFLMASDINPDDTSSVDVLFEHGGSRRQLSVVPSELCEEVSKIVANDCDVCFSGGEGDFLLQKW